MADPGKVKKIFVLGPTESLLTRRGNRHPALAQFLVEQGYEVEYITSDFYHAEKRWFTQEEILDVQRRAPYKLTVKKCLGYWTNVSPRRIISNQLLSIKFFFYLLPRLNSKTIIILPSRPVEMIFAAAMLRLLRGASVALDIQDVWPDMLVVDSRIKRSFFHLYCNSFLYPSLRFIDKFFHVAPSFVNWLHRYSPDSQSIFIPLGFDETRWSEVNPDREAKSEAIISIVCVGMLQRQIDVMPVLEAIADRNDIHLTIIGDDGEGERYSQVINFISENNMKNVTMFGRVEPEAMGDCLQHMDIGLVPMLSSSIPNKVFDYIACYLPILVLGDNDTAHFVEQFDIGWSCSYNVEGVKSLLSRIDHVEIGSKRQNIYSIRNIFDRNNLFTDVINLLVENGVSTPTSKETRFEGM